MSLYQDYKHYFDELDSEIRGVEVKGPSDEQKASIQEARRQLQEAISAKTNVEMLSHLNLARTQRAKYLPDSDLLAMVIAEQKRDKDFLDQKTRDAWEEELDNINKKLRDSPGKEDIYQCRQLLFRYFQQAGRKWNSANVREDSKMVSWIRLSLVSSLAVLLVLIALKSDAALLSALFGGLGGLVSSMNLVQDFPVQFRAKRSSIFAFFTRPLTGSIVGIMLFQFLVSGISPIQITPWEPATKTAWIAAISFAGGLSERFVLGKLGLSD